MSEWNETKERSNTLALSLICWIALHLSRWFARLWLWPISLYFYLTSPKVRFSSRRYLARVGRDRFSSFDVFHHIHHFSAVILDRVYFLTDQFDRFDIKVYGDECLSGPINDGKGAIFLGTHMGSFDALRCLALSQKNLRLKILMYHDHNAMITNIMNRLNPEISASVINLADQNALLQMKEAIDEGFMVGILGDRVLKNEKSVQCEFLGNKVNFPAGPLTLATILGVPVYTFFSIYQGGNQYEIYFSSLYEGESLARQARIKVVEDYTQHFVDQIESMVLKHPLNWFNFYDFWGDGK